VGCNAGECLVTLASGRTTPSSLATDSTNVYFTDVNGVESVSVAGGSVTTIAPIAANGLAQGPDGVVQAGSYVYIITPSYVYRQAKTGIGNPTQLATLANGSGGITTDANNVYWSDFRGGTIYSMPLSGGPSMLVSSVVPSPLLLAVYGSNAYTSPGGGVYSVPISGGSPVTTISASTDANELATGASGVYWTGGATSDAIVHAPLGSTTATTLLSGQSTPWGIAVDTTTIYWSNQGTSANNYTDGSVVSMPIGGSTPTTLAGMQGQPEGIVVDATSVYWVNYGAGTVMRLTPK
jgi:sugar lactone lactonase YvrE